MSNQRSPRLNSRLSNKLRPKFPSRYFFFFSYQRRTLARFGQATAIWVKRHFAHDEIFRLLAEQRGKRRPCREAQPTMLYQKRQVVLYNFG